VALATTPAAYTFFPEVPGLARWIRVVVAGIWVALFIAGAWVASGRDLFVDSELRRYSAKRTEDVDIAAAVVFPAVLDATSIGLPDHYDLTLYVLDQDAGELVPAYPDPGRGPDDVRVFKPGVGAVGRAYLGRRVVYARGPAVSDPSFGLSSAQMDFYSGFSSVAALAIRDGDQVVGVVSAMSGSDDGAFADSAAVVNFQGLADVLGTLLSLFGIVEA
jgi:hypothetical protein